MMDEDKIIILRLASIRVLLYLLLVGPSQTARLGQTAWPHSLLLTTSVEQVER